MGNFQKMKDEELEKFEEELLEQFDWLEDYIEVNDVTEGDKIAEQLEKRLLALYNWGLAKNMADFGGHLVYYRSKRIAVSIKANYSNVENKLVITIDYNDFEIGVNLIDKTEVEDGQEQLMLISVAKLLYRISSHCPEDAEWIWLPIDEEGDIDIDKIKE